MLERTKNMKYSYVNNKGFISAYFLVIFLYVITLVTVLSTNLNYQAKTLENLEIIYAYQQEELSAIARLKKELCTEMNLEDKYQIRDRYIYIQLTNEIVIVEYDPDKKVVLDYEVTR
ncbi:hypothetical protein [Solobacterium sp.]|uniref:hypothetical protein n=2 Tax=Solobacterium sp. TaxID=2060878 RepID=UPI001CB3B7BE|nr:hypothetical protein [Solobacterium sp.]MBF1084884.1 hypothetical protein [Solobacterium sp.]